MKENSTHPLVVGMRLKLLSDLPEYQVAVADEGGVILEINGQTPSYFSRPLPDRIYLTKNDPPYTIGRAFDNSFTVDDNRLTLSRYHCRIQYGKSGWEYVHLGSHVGEITTPPSYHQTSTFRGDETIFMAQPPSDPVVIEDGMFFQFHPSLPLYHAHIKDGELNLSRYANRRKGDTVIPEIIHVSKHDPIILGEENESEVNCPIKHSHIQGRHARIYWDSESAHFIYEPLNNFSPVIRTPNMLENLARGLPSLQLSPEEAERQLQETKALLKQLDTHKAHLEKVQFLETKTIIGFDDQEFGGALAEDAHNGYQLWLRIFELLHREELTSQALTALNHAADLLQKIGIEREEIRDIEVTEQGGIKAVKGATFNLNEERTPKMNAFIERKYQELETQGKIYLPTSFKGHHTITSIEKSNERYLVTVYNAGAESNLAGNDKEYVLGKEQHYLKEDKNVRNYIQALVKRKTRPKILRQDDDGVFKSGDSVAASYLDDELIGKRIVHKQHKGNCTTRSQRLLLQDLLDQDNDHITFDKMHRCVANPDVAPIEDLEAALEMKQKALQKILTPDVSASQAEAATFGADGKGPGGSEYQTRIGITT